MEEEKHGLSLGVNKLAAIASTKESIKITKTYRKVLHASLISFRS